MDTIYIETSIVSYLRVVPTSNIKTLNKQAATKEWWSVHRNRFELRTSQYVVDEASVGNPALADERIANLSGISLVELSTEIDDLAAEIIARAILPTTAIVDALHIAATVIHRINFLLTWNCTHIANPMILPRVFRVIDDFNYPFPVICTPQDMLDWYSNGD